MHKYALRYDFCPEFSEDGFTREDAGDKGLCDALIYISILYDENGSCSQAVVAVDGKEQRELTSLEICKSWIALGLSLHDEGKLKGSAAILTKIFAEYVRSIINSGEPK